MTLGILNLCDSRELSTDCFSRFNVLEICEDMLTQAQSTSRRYPIMPKVKEERTGGVAVY